MEEITKTTIVGCTYRQNGSNGPRNDQLGPLISLPSCLGARGVRPLPDYSWRINNQTTLVQRNLDAVSPSPGA